MAADLEGPDTDECSTAMGSDAGAASRAVEARAAVIAASGEAFGADAPDAQAVERGQEKFAIVEVLKRDAKADLAKKDYTEALKKYDRALSFLAEGSGCHELRCSKPSGMSCMGMARWLALLLLPVLTGAGTVEVENGVYKLDATNFDKAINKYPVVMVKFYAPWCGHCKTLAPKFEKAARKLRNQTDVGPRLAKVDCTVEEALKNKYEVTGFPTLLVFKDGQLLETYDGQREKSDIVDYMNSFTWPTPAGEYLRHWYKVRGGLKEVVLPLTPKSLRKPVRQGLAAIVAAPFALLLCCCVCCGRSNSPPKKAQPKAKAKASAEGAKKEQAESRPARASSPGANRQKEATEESKKDS